MGNKKKNQNSEDKKSLSEIINSYLDIPPDILPHGSLVELRGRNSVTVSGCKKILLYTPCEIQLSLHKESLCIKGKRLVCTSYHIGGVEIDGVIDCICFKGEDE